MRRSTGITRCLVLSGVLGCGLAAAAVASPADAPPPAPKAAKASKAAAAPMTEEQMGAEMMRLATPGPNHAMLGKSAGSWKTVTRMWAGPGDPQVSEGSSEATMILGGRYLKEEFKGTMMGQPFEGFGLTGFDNKSGRFQAVWVDVMTTKVLNMDGAYDPATKSITFKGVMDLVGPPVPYRMVSKILDDNHHTFTMYETRGGKEVKSMEIEYTRK